MIHLPSMTSGVWYHVTGQGRWVVPRGCRGPRIRAARGGTASWRSFRVVGIRRLWRMSGELQRCPN